MAQRDAIHAAVKAALVKLFTEPIGDLVINDLPLQLLVVDIEETEVKKWIPERPTEKSSKL